VAVSPSTTRSAFVTAGTSAIGSAIVRRLADSGHSVAFSYRNKPEAARLLAAECQAMAYRLDFEQEWAAPNLAVDVLVNNAGISLSGHTIWETPTRICSGL